MDRFAAFKHRFTTASVLWEQMAATVENSPWHREASVAEHTRMILEFYDRNLAHHRSESMRILTRVAALFHDTGKPAARTLKVAPDGTERHIYAGHEQISARLFEDFMMENWEWAFETLRLSWTDFRAVKWMIEHHLPFGITRPEKLSAMKRDLVAVLGDRADAFYDLVLSDCMGRISDDHPAKITKVEEWVVMFKKVEPTPLKTFRSDGDAPIAYVLIGASGSGKSTFVTNTAGGIPVVSLDAYRLDFLAAHEPHHVDLNDPVRAYASAFTYANDNDAAFRAFYTPLFLSVLRSGRNVVIDNTNTSRKARAFWIELCRQHKYRVVAVEFPIAVADLMSRQDARKDKCVPPVAVMQQYFRIASPAIGTEVDEVMVFAHNKLHLVTSS